MDRVTRRTILSIVASAVTIGFLPAFARAADRQQELRDRFKARLGEIREAKSSGKIGETIAGLLEAVNADAIKGDDKLKKLVDEENADRHELYKLIADREKTAEDKVAERAANRNFEKAKAGEYLKDRDGKWKRK